MSTSLYSWTIESALPTHVEQRIPLIAGEGRLVMRLRIEARCEALGATGAQRMALEELRANREMLSLFLRQPLEQSRGRFGRDVGPSKHLDRIRICLRLVRTG